MAIRSVESLREKLRRDTNPLEMLMSLPATHRFLESVTVEGYEAIADEIEREVAERFMELPLDADGVPIRVGDVVEAGFYGTQEIAGVSGENSDFPYVFFFPDDGTEAQWCEAQDCHRHAPTVEDVLQDMLDNLDLDPTSHVDTGAVVTEYAAKLRLAGDGE